MSENRIKKLEEEMEKVKEKTKEEQKKRPKIEKDRETIYD